MSREYHRLLPGELDMSPELSEAANKCPLVAALLKADATPDTVLLLLVDLKIKLSQDLDELRFTEPKRVRMPDGLIMVWLPEALLLDAAEALRARKTPPVPRT